MPHTTIRPDGRVTYRTALFTALLKAQAFARCLQANSSRFESVLVHSSTTAKTPKWFVTFLPASDTRQDALHQAQQDARALRALSQEFIFWPDPDAISTYWCYSVSSGETYEVSLGDCSCPDHQFRCRNAGIQCKHQIAWSLERAAARLAA